MAKTELPPPDLLRKLLRYDPDTGRLFWLHRDLDAFNATPARSAEHTQKLWNFRYAGAEAFTALNTAGYRQGNIFSKQFVAHRIIWAIAYGALGDEEIDHVDGDRTNNRLTNLRVASRSENQHNRKIARHNTSGFKGVSWMARDKLWRARIGVGGKRHRLGDFGTIEEAAAAYARASAEMHGAFSRIK